MHKLTPIQNPFRTHRTDAMVAKRSLHAQPDSGVAPRRIAHSFARDGSKTLAGMLLAAMLAALLVVADQLIETWADGHLLLVWVALWAVMFGVLSYLMVPMRTLAGRVSQQWAHWMAGRMQRRADEALWELAQRDHRVMNELAVARMRADAE